MQTLIANWQVQINRILKIFCIFSLCFFAIFCIFSYTEIYINTTKSLPIGLYQKKKSVMKIAVGDIVLIDKDKISGIDKNRVKKVHLLLKKILGEKGDMIEFDKTKQQVKVNGKNISGMFLKVTDKFGKKIECTMNYPCIVPAGYYFVGTNYENGYDSRYFGLVPQNAILGKVHLIHEFK